MGSTNSFNLLSTHNYRMMLRTLFILSMSVLQASHGSPTREKLSGNETTTTTRADFSRNGYSCETNDWDKPQWGLCQKGERVSKIYSYHDNKKEDRRWTLTCGAITPEFIVPNKNDWYEKSKRTIGMVRFIGKELQMLITDFLWECRAITATRKKTANIRFSQFAVTTGTPPIANGTVMSMTGMANCPGL